VTSQSPDSADTADSSESDPYLDSWAALSHMIMEQGASWSGREKNCAYLNLGNGNFANVSASTGADYSDDARAVALLDWDGDGAMDLLVKNRTAPRLRLLRNQATSDHHWLRVKLQGTGKSNRDAIGARLRLLPAEGKTLMRSIYAGDSYLAQSSRIQHFGLGDSSDPVALQVTWPDGAVESFQDLAVDQGYLLVQGAGKVAPLPMYYLPGFAKVPTSKLAADTDSSRRAVLADRLPLSNFPLPAYANPKRKVSDLKGGPVLINLWATTCANCFRELADFATHAEQLSAAGLRIVPMNTGPKEDEAHAHEKIQALGMDQHAGPNDDSFMGPLQLLFTEVMGPNAPSVLPTSLLLDNQGRLCVVYQGPVSAETLLADLKSLQQSKPGSRFTDRLAGGTWLATRIRDFDAFATGLRQAGYPDLAQDYAKLATDDPLRKQ
jgi:peroxiredoxin